MSSLLAALSHRFEATGVHALAQFDAANAFAADGRSRPGGAGQAEYAARAERDVTYEAALVFGLPDEVASCVEALRAELRATTIDPSFVLAPHLTVLFLGRWPAVTLERFIGVLRSLPRQSVKVELDGLGVFEADGAIKNIHLRCGRADGLYALHHRAVAACREAGWTPQSRYVEDTYVPHVSVFDGLHEPLSRKPELLASAPPSWQGPLDELCVIGKRVGGGTCTTIS